MVFTWGRGMAQSMSVGASRGLVREVQSSQHEDIICFWSAYYVSADHDQYIHLSLTWLLPVYISFIWWHGRVSCLDLLCMSFSLNQRFCLLVCLTGSFLHRLRTSESLTCYILQCLERMYSIPLISLRYRSKNFFPVSVASNSATLVFEDIIAYSFPSLSCFHIVNIADVLT